MEGKFELLYFLLTILLIDYSLSFSDTPEHFCGAKLANYLSTNCRYFNSPYGIINKIRSKRAVVDECCKSPCTTRYLLCNYCAEVKSEEVCADSGASYLKEAPAENFKKFSYEVNGPTVDNDKTTFFLCRFKLCSHHSYSEFFADQLNQDVSQNL